MRREEAKERVRGMRLTKRHREAMRSRLKKPLFHWMMEFVEDLRRLVPEEGKLLSFEFLYHIQFHNCSEESENVICASGMFWFITITDGDGSSVHPNWTIAMDFEGDLVLKRGACDETGVMHDGEYYVCERAESRIRDVVREHLRLRALKTARTK
jgi:hypothetical protein